MCHIMQLENSLFEEVTEEGKILRQRVIEKVGPRDGMWVSPGITQVDGEFALLVLLQSEQMSNVSAVRQAIGEILHERNSQRKSQGKGEMPVKIHDIGKIHFYGMDC